MTSNIIVTSGPPEYPLIGVYHWDTFARMDPA